MIRTALQINKMDRRCSRKAMLEVLEGGEGKRGYLQHRQTDTFQCKTLDLSNSSHQTFRSFLYSVSKSTPCKKNWLIFFFYFLFSNLTFNFDFFKRRSRERQGDTLRQSDAGEEGHNSHQHDRSFATVRPRKR